MTFTYTPHPDRVDCCEHIEPFYLDYYNSWWEFEYKHPGTGSTIFLCPTCMLECGYCPYCFEYQGRSMLIDERFPVIGEVCDKCAGVDDAPDTIILRSDVE